MNIAERLKQDSFQQGIHAGMQQGIHAGMQQGMKKGEHEKAIAIARNLLSKNADILFIKEVTGLSDRDLSKLMNNH